MAGAAVGGALLGLAFEETFKVSKKALMISIFCNSSCKKLKATLIRLKPTIDEISVVGSESSQHWQRQVQEFQDKIGGALDLIEKCQNTSRFHLYRKFRYAKRILNFEKDIHNFMLTHIVPNIMLDLKKLGLSVPDFSQRLRRLGELACELNNVLYKMANDVNANNVIYQQIPGNTFSQETDDDGMSAEAENSSYYVPDMPNFVVGFDNFITDLKKLLFQSDVNAVGVTGMSGRGKTTLAQAFCNDDQVKEFFGTHIVFVTVSQNPNLLEVLKTMWQKIVGGENPNFQSVEDAHNQLKRQIRLNKYPTLVVLDDVWSQFKLEKLLFEGEGYKTLVTTRYDNTIPRKPCTRLYSLPLMQEADALSLFCFWAFGEASIPKTEDQYLVKQVQAECKGLPLALKVIGSSLRSEPRPVWESAKNRLSRAEYISDYHKETLYECLKPSIDVLDEETKQCFLDLGAFPEGRKNCVDALLDIWVYVRGMDWQDAFVVLLELASRNLLDLTSYPGSQAISFDTSCELSFSQHDVIRDLALHLASCDDVIHCKRLFMPRKENCVPVKWKALKDHPSEAQIISIHTGALDEKQWCQIDLPQAEALVLFFTADEYWLPTFLHTMPKLKVLIICNYSSKRATLRGIASFHSLTQLKSIIVERLMVPPIYEFGRSSENLEKLYLSLCEGLGNMNEFIKELKLSFPKLLGLALDHCSDLEELPTQICDLTSLQRLAVTNCHLVHKLPDDLGRLSLLRVLILSACPRMVMLPPSIGKLGNLEFLDISLCSCLKQLPEGLGQLCSLKKLDMRECFGLRLLPKALGKLRSLRHVICDEKIEQQWLAIRCSAMPELIVEKMEEHFHLDWLDN
eukprot:Gb_41060 [translate_table: standard]